MRYNTKKRAKEMRLYSKLRKQFLEENPQCMAGLKGCTHQATTVHHQLGRVGLRLIDVHNFLGCCMSCHQKIEHEPEMSKLNGLSKSRLT